MQIGPLMNQEVVAVQNGKDKIVGVSQPFYTIQIGFFLQNPCKKTNLINCICMHIVSNLARLTTLECNRCERVEGIYLYNKLGYIRTTQGQRKLEMSIS